MLKFCLRLKFPQFILNLVAIPMFSEVFERFPESLGSIEVLWVGEKSGSRSAHEGSKIFEIFFLENFYFRQEKIFDLGGGARYPLLCKFLAR